MPSDLAQLNAAGGRVRGPDYDRRAVATGIIHLGLGSFHRAHQAMYTDATLAQDPSWGICGVSLRSAGVVDALRRQDHLYTLLARGREATQARIIGSVHRTLGVADGMHAVIGRIAAQATRIASLTITEKAYCHRPATGRLDTAHPQIAHDLAHAGDRDAWPQSALGVLLRGLAARMAHGTPLSILCCDNLPHNGATLRGLVLEFAGMTNQRLARWIETELTFPSTMVDRIVPAASADAIAIARDFGLDDAIPVSTEPFSQWVIEDHFAAGRPAWQDAGAQLVTEVAPFELMKLRLLNGAHSCMAYLGHLAGHEYVHQVISDPLFAAAIERLWRELVPTLPPALASMPGVDIAAYQRALMQRFRNPALQHRTWQIAMDGSQKLPQRLLNAARERLLHNQGVDSIALAVAGWMRYVAGRDDQGNNIDVRDPLATQCAAIAAVANGDCDALGRGLLGLASIFGDDLPHDPRFVDALLGWLRPLALDGVRATLARAAGGAAS